MKRATVLAALICIAGATVTVLAVGLAPLMAAVGRLGWRSLVTLILVSAVPIALLATAWAVLEAPWRVGTWGRFVWARLVREAAGELLPFSHVGGLAFGARAAVMRGLARSWTLASLVVDVTTEMTAQLAFTALGAVLAIEQLGGARRELLAGATAGLAVSAAAIAGFVWFQRRGLGAIARFAERFAPTAADVTSEVHAHVLDIYRRPGRVAIAVLVHVLAWVGSAFGVWLALAAGGVSANPLSILGLESLVLAARSAVVIAPMGLGVQEAGYAVLGPLFGLGPDVAVALSLIKRARDLVVGVPVLAIWQIEEGRRLTGRVRVAPGH